MKILYVTTVSGTINAFLVPHIKMLLEQGYQVDIACNITHPIHQELIEYGCKVFNIEFQRSPLSMENFRAYKMLKKVIRKGDYKLVHTHTPVASVITRLVCKNIDDIKVVYTAHGFHFFKNAPIKNWLVYFPIEYWLSRYTDVLITINEEDYLRAQKHFKSNNNSIKYLPGVGLDIDEISQIVVNKPKKRKELRVQESDLILLSVGELNKNKNHSTIIKAIAKLENPSICYLICGQGPLEDDLIQLIKDKKLENQVKLLGYREDILEIYKISDVFIFPSFREGLSVALMEAMACGLPIISSNIRGNRDLVKSGEGGFLVHPKDIEGFAKNIDILVSSRNLRIKMGQENSTKIYRYQIKTVLDKLNQIYNKMHLLK